MKCQNLRNNAFTIVELLVVIAILGILMALIFPGLAGSRERARLTACLSNMRQWGMALMEYVDDQSGGQLPAKGSVDDNNNKANLNSAEAWFNVLPPLFGETPLKERYDPATLNPLRDGDRSLFICPSLRYGDLPGGFNPEANPVFSYAYNLWLDNGDRDDSFPTRLFIDHIQEPSLVVAFGDVAGFELSAMAGPQIDFRHGQGDAVNLCFVDGSAKTFRRHEVYVSETEDEKINRGVLWHPNEELLPPHPE